LAAVLLSAAGCDLQRRPADPLAGSIEEIPILIDQVGAYSNLRREARVVIYDQPMLDQLPVRIRPVDFSQEMVLFAGLGPTPSPDYSVAIDRVERRGRQIHVHVVKSYPSPEHRLSPGLASPYCVAVVPRSDLIVSGFDGRWPEHAFSNSPSGRR
jgi:hypothetical protein